MTKHFIFDFETMGTEITDCAVIDCSYFTFNTDKMLSDSPYTSRDIINIQRGKFDVADQVKTQKYVVYPDTLEFWKSQPESVRRLILPSKESDLPLLAALEKLDSYLAETGPVKYWWARSCSFDATILWRLLRDCESPMLKTRIHNLIPHWKLRDTRTFIDAKLDFPKVNGFVPIQDEDFWNKIFQVHNSSWDVLADVLRYQAIVRAQNDLEQVKR